MRILALDTATTGCSLAILDGDTVLVRHCLTMERGQSEQLLPLIARGIAESGLAFNQLDAVAATTGPGAFTGIRIGLAAARGLALALDRPGIGISCFDVFAAMAETPDKAGASPLLIALESKRRELYLQARLTQDSSTADRLHEQALAPDDIPGWLTALEKQTRQARPWTLIGDAAGTVASALSEDRIARVSAQQPDPVQLAQLAGQRLRQGDISPLAPRYMRAADATPAADARIWLAESQ